MKKMLRKVSVDHLRKVTGGGAEVFIGKNFEHGAPSSVLVVLDNSGGPSFVSIIPGEGKPVIG